MYISQREIKRNNVLALGFDYLNNKIVEIEVKVKYELKVK